MLSNRRIWVNQPKNFAPLQVQIQRPPFPLQSSRLSFHHPQMLLKHHSLLQWKRPLCLHLAPHLNHTNRMTKARNLQLEILKELRRRQEYETVKARLKELHVAAKMGHLVLETKDRRNPLSQEAVRRGAVSRREEVTVQSQQAVRMTAELLLHPKVDRRPRAVVFQIVPTSPDRSSEGQQRRWKRNEPKAFQNMECRRIRQNLNLNRYQAKRQT